MAENQTASEDSGEQQQQDQQTNNQPAPQQDSSPDQESSSDSITPNPRSKSLNMRNSLTCIKLPRPVTSTSTSVDGSTFKNPGKHHHHNHNHVHNHNSTSSGHQDHHVIHRTTSESLRLGSDYPPGNGGVGTMTNSTSNSSSIRDGSSSLAATTTKSSNSTTSNHSHSMSSSSSPSLTSRPHSHPHLPSNEDVQIQRKPKTSSFQITSVTVGSKLSSDNGEDSADDLDESHTDDNSRITDLENETPSVSEDTFSKEDVFFANNALSTTAPVIPTSTQYGLVVVDPISTSVGQTIQNVQVNVAENVINVVSSVDNNKKKPEVKETQHRSERFKVVKIESTEPFRRGRWMCMDYLDHSGNQTINKDIKSDKISSGSIKQGASGISSITSGEETLRGATKTKTFLTNDSNATAATGGIGNHIDAAAKLAADGNLNIYRSEFKTNTAGTGMNFKQPTAHAQTMGGPLNIQPQQTLQQSQLPNQFQNSGHGQTMPMAAAPINQQSQINGNETNSVAGQSQPASFFANQLNASPTVVVGVNSAPPTFQQPQPQPAPVQGVTLPANIQLQNRVEVPPVTGFPNASYLPPFEGGELSHATSLPTQPTSQQFESPIGHGQTIPMVASQLQAVQSNQQAAVNGTENVLVAGQSQPVGGFFPNPLNTSASVGAVAAVAAGSSAAPPAFPQQQSTPVHAATLPASIQLQNGAGAVSGAVSANVPAFPNVSYVAAFEGVTAPPATALPIQHTGQQPQPYPVYYSQNIAGPKTYAGAAISGAAYAISVNQQLALDAQAAINPGVVASGQLPQTQPQQQFQPIHSNPLAGQSMPMINQMNYNIQGQQQLPQPTPQAATINTPATISDPTVIASTIQQQQPPQQPPHITQVVVGGSSQTIINPSEGVIVNANAVVGGGSVPRSTVQIQQQPPISSSSSMSVAGSVQGSTSVGNVAVASTMSTTTDDNQLHHVSETETESSDASSLTLALANRSKRNSSIKEPSILAPIYSFNESTDSLNNITDVTDATDGKQNLFTNLALGDERYMLPNRVSPSVEAIESIGKNSPTAGMRSLPILIGGPSGGGGIFSRQTSDSVMTARSASPTTFQYSPFYYGSPTSPESLASQPISMSYDPNYGCASTRLNVPTLMSHGHHGAAMIGDNNRLIRVIDGCGRSSGIDGHDGKSSAATAVTLASAGGASAPSVLNRYV